MSDELRHRVVDLGRAVAQAGLVVAAGGNIVVRADRDRLWVTPTGWNLAELRPGDLAEVSSDGRHVGGAHAATSELPMHLAALRTRPESIWSLHLHPPMATLLDALGVPIRAITTDHAYYLRSVAAAGYRQPGTAAAADAVASALTTGADVVLLRHHGCLILADTAQEALSRALNLEAAATATFRARLLGDETTACPPEFLAQVRAEEAAGRRYGARRVIATE